MGSNQRIIFSVFGILALMSFAILLFQNCGGASQGGSLSLGSAPSQFVEPPPSDPTNPSGTPTPTPSPGCDKPCDVRVEYTSLSGNEIYNSTPAYEPQEFGTAYRFMACDVADCRVKVRNYFKPKLCTTDSNGNPIHRWRAQTIQVPETWFQFNLADQLMIGQRVTTCPCSPGSACFIDTN